MITVEWFPAATLTELTLLTIAFLLCALIGLERQRRLKSAGLRTHTLVGLGSTLFTLVSAHGFSSITNDTSVILDPSRIAAQIVSGIGFLGAGVIFVRRDAVSGLTTAASIWVAAAVGMTCGAGMPLLATAATALHLGAMLVLGRLGRRFRDDAAEHYCTVRYRERQGVLRTVLLATAGYGYEATLIATEAVEKPGKHTRIKASLRFRGNPEPEPLLEALAMIPGVDSVRVATETDQS